MDTIKQINIKTYILNNYNGNAKHLNNYTIIYRCPKNITTN